VGREGPERNRKEPMKKKGRSALRGVKGKGNFLYKPPNGVGGKGPVRKGPGGDWKLWRTDWVQG